MKLIIDADSLIYRVAATSAGILQARNSLERAIHDIIYTLSGEEVLVLVKGENNFRYDAYPEYKSHRPDSLPQDIRDRVNELYEYAYEIYSQCHGGEADDYASMLAEQSYNQGESFIVCHLDKDLDTIPGTHYNYSKGIVYEVTPLEGYRFLMKQLLMGDSTDNIKGCYKVGAVKADRILDSETDPSKWLDLVVDTYKNIPVEGWDWKLQFYQTANCIYLRTNMDDLRVLTHEELMERFKWNKIMDTGLPSQNDPTMPSDSSTQSSAQQEDNT
jgi:5'-3' exonuclease